MALRRFGMGRYALGVINAAIGDLGEDSQYCECETIETDENINNDVAYDEQIITTKIKDDDFRDLLQFDDGVKFIHMNSIDNMEAFRALLASAYNEDRDQFIRNIMASGSTLSGANEDHAAYMVGLAWLWELHPETFMECVAPYVGDNSSYVDLLTLLSVITFNRSFPFEVLTQGKDFNTFVKARRASLHLKEKTIWKDLLGIFGVTSDDVVRPRTLSRARMRAHRRYLSYPATLRREETATGYISSYISTPETPISPACDTNLDISWSSPVGNRPTYVFGTTHSTGMKSSSSATTVDKKKNVWLNEAFKLQWQCERAKLHRRDYETSYGISGTTGNYETLVEFVVSCFATGIITRDPLVAKWAPMPGGAHDISTKGIDAFQSIDDCNLSIDWGVSGGIAQAIAYRIYGEVLKQRMAEDATIGVDVLSVYAQKVFVMTLYKDAISKLRDNGV